MKLTAFTDYSLRVLMYLGATGGQRATIAQIAQAYDVSENHLVKVVHFLGKKGWLANVRGKGGGLELAMAPARIKLGDVVRETEGEMLAAECFGDEGGDCCLSPACHLRGVLGQAIAAFYSVLDRHTLADVIDNREQLVQLLFIPLPARRAA
jgi:Rrf2 family transcriptional regulator, nitric oxide-sensitive transcriptional repressor